MLLERAGEENKISINHSGICTFSLNELNEIDEVIEYWNPTIKSNNQINVKVTNTGFEDNVEAISSFDEITLPKSVNQIIDGLNFTELTPIQANGIPLALSGRNMVGVASTGSGKTLAFMLPAIVKILEDKLSHIKAPISLSIIGCVVNGPGEAAQTDIGISGGGKGNNMLYLSGIQTEKVLTKDIISKVVELVEKKAQEIENNN